MKKMKKFLAVMLAAIMVMSMGTSVFAATEGTDADGNTIYYNESTEADGSTVVTYYDDAAESNVLKVVTTSSDGSTVKTEEYSGGVVVTTTVEVTDSEGNVTTTVTDASGTTTTYTLTITGVQSDAHTYQAYQIFAGTLSDDETTLSDITWGTGVSDTASYGDNTATPSTYYANIYAELRTVSIEYNNTTIYPFTSDESSSGSAFTTASEVATALSTYASVDGFGEKFADIVAHYLTSTVSGTSGTATQAADDTYTYTISGLSAGYYLIMDQANSLSSGSDEAYTDYIVQIIKATTVKVKEEVPSVTKYVSNGTSTAQSSSTDDAVSASIGSELTFTLVGTLPSSTTLSAYDAYTYIFHDALSDGLTLDENSITVYATNDISSLTASNEIGTSYYDVDTTTSFLDDCTFEVSFSDILTAYMSDSTTLVTSYTYIVVQYTASLNEDAVIGYSSTDENSNTVYLEYSNDPNSSSSSASGGSGTPSSDDPTGTTTKEKVNVYAYELDITKADGTDSSATKLSGAVFVLYDSEGNYAKIDSTGTVTGWDTAATYTAATDKSSYQVTSGTSGEIIISGLGEGTYYLQEITAPSGYNLLSSAVTIVISASETSSGVTSLTAVVTVEGTPANVTSTDNKTLAITIVNTKGSSLPTTGGIGTTMFYVVGMILVLGAAVVLVTRRRMGNRA